MTTKETLESGHMVPITREFLKNYYESIDDIVLSSELSVLQKRFTDETEQLKQLISDNKDAFAGLDVDSFVSSVFMKHRHKIDENVMRCRQEMEELDNLFGSTALDALKAKFTEGGMDKEKVDICASTLEEAANNAMSAANATIAWQKENVDRVMNIISLFLPKDGFRASIVRQVSERGDKKKKGEVEALVKSGCTIREKFDLLWKQQLDRRALLIRIGDASGPFRFVLRFLAGVPQVLLDFAKQINDDQGPLEETRSKYGPNVYILFEFANCLHLYSAFIVKAIEKNMVSSDKILDGVKLIKQSVDLFVSEMDRFLKHMTFLFEESPFFITEEEAAAMTAASKNLPYIELVVPARRTAEATLRVEQPGMKILWNFSTLENDISYSLVCRPLPCTGRASSGSGSGSSSVPSSPAHVGSKGKSPSSAALDVDPTPTTALPTRQQTIAAIEVGVGLGESVVQATQRVNSHVEPVMGEHVCTECGLYVLVFDNTYSYFKSKTVHYTFEHAEEVEEK